ncbi:MAG: hypothetical protein KDE68_01405, partial [Rhodocyclaceae bacterium]|nr:hypothetical protein [Rhodocyclaceae bacterium]
MKIKQSVIAMALTAAAFAGMSGSASAHTVAVGTVNAGAPGSVTIWLGSYHTNAPNEGSLTLDGVTQAFDMVSNVLPTGLVVGSNYFFATSTATAGEFTASTNTSGIDVVRWQGVTFTGLAAGDYLYSVTGMNTVNFADWNSDQSNWTGTLNIP